MAEKKNVGLAVIYSLLLPGMGEMYAGRYETGKYFTIAEGVLLVTLLSFDRAGAWLRDDARRFAVQHAQLNGTSQSDQFYIDIGNDSSVYAFNERILRSRDVSRIYDTDPASPSYWRWETDQQRATYRSIRVSSDRWFNNTRFVVAAIGANHIISAINAARSVISHNKDFDGALGSLSIRADVIGGLSTPDGIRVSITKQF
jgi:TM2 domain-containing membrane protein YozV